MPRTDINRINRECSSGEFQPVYFLHGDESYLTRRAVETLTAHAVDSASADFNYERFHGPDMNIERVLTSVATPPMMAARRVVLVQELDKAQLKVRELLADYAEKPSDSTVLILASSSRIKIDKRRGTPKWAAKLEDAAASACFWPLRENELLSWIVSTAGLAGKKIGRQAALDLYARLGDDLARIAGELDKLTFFIGEREEISPEDVRAMTGVDKGASVFDWVDSLAAGKPLLGAYITGQLASRGESAVGALAAASAHFGRVARIRALIAQGVPDAQVKKELGLSWWRDEAVRDLFNQARRFNDEQLERVFSLLLETDLRLKSSSLPNRLILESLAFSLTGDNP
ncbi:MAG: DNA polymerase III subunit delta [Candidatus Glassbacteria bacterium]|nr:DNA polymerase III subunit delta [Candidatus Glassbacteria bacterium]